MFNPNLTPKEIVYLKILARKLVAELEVQIGMYRGHAKKGNDALITLELLRAAKSALECGCGQHISIGFMIIAMMSREGAQVFGENASRLTETVINTLLSSEDGASHDPAESVVWDSKRKHTGG